MDASTVIAICATVIALLSLAVSVYQVQATRRHYRLSVRPLLELRDSFRQGHRAGLQLINTGLGPAAITKTVLVFDGKSVGEFNKSNVNKVRDKLSFRPAAVTFNKKTFLPTDYEQFLLSIEPFDYDKHTEFADLLGRRLSLEIHYESLYGGDSYKTVWPEQPQPDPGDTS